MPVFQWQAIRIFPCCLAIVYFCFGPAGGTTFECNYNPDSVGAGNVPPTDTLKALVLYTTDTPPVWWRRVWNPDSQLSVPRFYKDNSFGKYILTADIYAFSGIQFIPIQKLDDSINFADYDNDGPNGIPASQDTCSDSACFADGWIGDDDGIVDAFFYVTVVSPFVPNSGKHPGPEVDTDDFSIGGRQIIIGGDITMGTGHSVECFVNSEEWGVFLPAHEWGHALGLPDLYGEFNGEDAGWWELGGLSVMAVGMTGLRPAPFDPWSRIRLGWVSPIEVTTPLYGQSIPDFHTTGTVYKLSKDLREYFLVTNHRGVDPFFEQRAYWEAKFKGYGLMMWHVDTMGCGQGCGLERSFRLIDPELAFGMYDTVYDAVNCGLDSHRPNPVSGLDSLDIGWALFNGCGYTMPDIMSETFFWNDSTGKTAFNDLSNPSSMGYGLGFSPENNRVQDIFTFLAVQGIRSPAPFTTAQADLIPLATYGGVPWQTTASGVVSLIGDFRVPSGATLTIAAGTTVRIQSNYDNQKSGVDTGKCEIIVEAGGRLIIGGPGNPVKFISSRPESLASTDDWRGIVVKSGGYISVNNAIIRHAYIGIEDESQYNHTIQNVKIGRCKAYGILASDTDSLTIRGCRVDSVNGSPGGYGIAVFPSASTRGARLVKDTVRACYVGIKISASTTPVESCVVVAATGGLTSNTGIFNLGQEFLTAASLPVTATSVDGYFTNEHFNNDNEGRVQITGCFFGSPTSPRSPNGIRNTLGDYLKLRQSSVTEWGSAGVLLESNGGADTTDLGSVASPADSGFNTIYRTGSESGWKYVKDNDYCFGCSNPTVKAEWNCYNTDFPQSNRFSPNVDWNPYDNSCCIFCKIAAGDGDVGIKTVKPTSLFQNYPNPFNPTTLIQFNLERPEKVDLEIFNILGQKVRTILAGEEFAAGPYTFLWDGKDQRGRALSSGVYFYRLQTPTYLQTKKMMLVK